MGVLLTSNAVFLGTRAVRAQGSPGDLRLVLFLVAASSLLFAVASFLRALGAPDSLWFAPAQMEMGLWVIRLAVNVFSGLRLWRQKRSRPAA